MVSEITGDSACPQCRENGRDKSGNHLIHFSNGNKYCNRCGYKEYGDNREEESMSYEYTDPPDHRGITAEYLTMYGVKASFSQSNGELEIIACPTHRNGEHVGYKRRGVADKTFNIEGSGKDLDLFGMNVSGGKRWCIITEGELDAVAAKQMIGNGANWYDDRPRDYTVVSVPHGANSKINKYSFEWLSAFDTLILATDMDEMGEALAQSINDLMPAGKCKRAVMPVKDAHQCLEDELETDFIQAVTNARAIVADGIVLGDQYFDEMLAEYRAAADGGIPYPPAFEPLNKMMYGMRLGEVDVFTSGSGMGKSQMFREIMHHLAHEHDQKVGGLILEEKVSRTLIGQLSITANVPLHLPEVNQATSDEDLKYIYDETNTQNLVLYDHFGGLEGDGVLNKIRFMAVAMGCQYIMLDHISIVISEFAADGDERRMIDQLMTKLVRLANELGIWIGVISHLRKTSSGPSFEEGAVPTLDDLRGSGSLKQLAYQVIALARNQQAMDAVVRNTTLIVSLKNRFCGRTGHAGLAYYDEDTGRMTESDMDYDEWAGTATTLETRL